MSFYSPFSPSPAFFSVRTGGRLRVIGRAIGRLVGNNCCAIRSLLVRVLTRSSVLHHCGWRSGGGAVAAVLRPARRRARQQEALRNAGRGRKEGAGSREEGGKRLGSVGCFLPLVAEFETPQSQTLGIAFRIVSANDAHKGAVLASRQRPAHPNAL